MVNRAVKGNLLNMITKDAARSIHVAALETLEKTGMDCTPKIAEVFRKAGADIENDGKRAKIGSVSKCLFVCF